MNPWSISVAERVFLSGLRLGYSRLRIGCSYLSLFVEDVRLTRWIICRCLSYLLVHLDDLFLLFKLLLHSIVASCYLSDEAVTLLASDQRDRTQFLGLFHLLSTFFIGDLLLSFFFQKCGVIFEFRTLFRFLSWFGCLIHHSTLILIFWIKLFVIVILHVTEVCFFGLFEVWIPGDTGCFVLLNFKSLTVELNTVWSNLVYIHGIISINFISCHPWNRVLSSHCRTLSCLFLQIDGRSKGLTLINPILHAFIGRYEHGCTLILALFCSDFAFEEEPLFENMVPL